MGGVGGDAYTRRVNEYDSLGRAVDTQLELPKDDRLVKAGVPSTLAFTSYYNIDGTLQNTQEPALGGLSAETVSLGYTGLGQVKTIAGSTGYLLDTDYSAVGQPQQLVLGTANTEAHKKAYVTHTYEEGTGRLTRSHVTDQTHPYMLQDLNYRFDEGGNVTSINDPTTLGGTGKAETQCFGYDGHRRLTEAWTPPHRTAATTAAPPHSVVRHRTGPAIPTTMPGSVPPVPSTGPLASRARRTATTRFRSTPCSRRPPRPTAAVPSRNTPMTRRVMRPVVRGERRSGPHLVRGGQAHRAHRRR
ncbi:hypothetical protein NKH18_13005 [Streptomyces sp. M10(2022)]